MDKRGTIREETLDAEVYYSDHYFSMPQLYSLSQQIYEINRLKPESILEIGPGNGFVSSFLKRAGYDVTTVDINPALHPDICAPLDQVSGLLNGRRYDLVVCCEVLEHMPLSELKNNLSYLRDAGKRLFMTLPNYKRSFGIAGLLRIPWIPATPFKFYVDVKKKKKLEDGPHFWEVGSESSSSKRAITQELLGFYSKVDTDRFGLNPYHLSFYAR